MINNFYLRLISIIFFSPIVIYFIFLGDFYFTILLFIIGTLCFFECSKLKKNYIKFLLIILIIIFLYICYEIRNSYDGNKLFFLVLFATWLSDIGGYLFGKIFKGPKINIISPNKTYNGFIGSIVLPQIVLNFLFYESFHVYEANFHNTLLIFSLSLSTIIGDLFFSFVKRKNKIKDFGNIVPGHGGLLDRIDGLIFSFLNFYFVNNIL